MIVLEQYIDRDGRNRFERWFNQLEVSTASRVNVVLNRLTLGSSTAKGVGSGVMELRLDFGPGYRIYFGRDGDAPVILLCGGDKKSQPTDIATAQDLWQEYKQRKRKR